MRRAAGERALFYSSEDADCGTARRDGKGRWAVYQALARNEAICCDCGPMRGIQVYPFEWVLETPGDIHSTRRYFTREAMGPVNFV